MQNTIETSQFQDLSAATEPQSSTTHAVLKGLNVSSQGVDTHHHEGRNDRIVSSVLGIFWNVAFLIFFAFFYKYIAWYHTQPDGSAVRLLMLTDEYFTWLPVLVIAIVINITTNIVIIVYDKLLFYHVIQIILNVIGIVVVSTLILIYPFDFSVIPDALAIEIVPIAVKILLILIATFLGFVALVQVIRIGVGLVKQNRG